MTNKKEELENIDYIIYKELDKSFEPKEIENRLYQEWENKGYFTSKINDSRQKNTYVIQSPPPNVTGTLHMGHAFNITIMDTLIRYKRMCDYDSILIPGSDHAGIATQLVVERFLESKNISKNDLGRESFIKEIWKWKNKSKLIITDQIKRLGTSADWSREYFTMDDNISVAVVEAFIKLYNDGLIYKGSRIVNWDPKLLTAVSDLEVQYTEIDGYMWYINYPFSNNDEIVTDENGNKIQGLLIATTRPETIFADSAICVHPKDSRYKNIIGKSVRIPLCDRDIKIISDDFVDPAFGSGCVKITGAHDFKDYECSVRHNLPLISIFTKEAKINDNAPINFRGLNRDQARKAVLEELKKKNLLIKTCTHKIMQPRGDRSGVTLEPMLTDQWFVAVSKPTRSDLFSNKSLAEIALSVVEKSDIHFYPDSWTNTYKQWLYNIQDWCISRQIWWGHQIPAWYSSDGKIFVAKNEEEAYKLAEKEGVIGKLNRDESVLDTWFSSALVPFATLGWPNKTNELEKYLPSNTLVTGFDIIFFWVTRMVMLTTYLTGKIPFKNVYIHGLIRDHNGQKMSKSKGNTIDPIDLIDGIALNDLIAKRTTGLINPKQSDEIIKFTTSHFPNGIKSFGTDALRFTMASYASLGRDINFDVKRCEGYRNFCNKLWNAARFILMQFKIDINTDIEKYIPEYSFTDKWIISDLQILKLNIEKSFTEYRLDNVANLIYKFVWEEYCDWYLECAKVQLKHENICIRVATKNVLINVFEEILRMSHPIIPFITEELWQTISNIKDNHKNLKSERSICVQKYPVFDKDKLDQLSTNEMLELKQYINVIRVLRSEMNISPAQKISALIEDSDDDHDFIKYKIPYILYLSKLSSFKIVNKLPDQNSIIHLVGKKRIMLDIKVDISNELYKIEKEISKLKENIEKIDFKLNNTNFIKKAPEFLVNKESLSLKEKKEILEKLEQQKNIYKNKMNN